MDIIDVRLIYYFSVIAKFLNFTKAAEVLFISQPSLSRQIKDLEQQIGVSLFIRNNKMVKLTPAGEVFLKESEKLLADMKNLMERTRRADKVTNKSLMFASISNDFFYIIKTLKAYENHVEGSISTHIDYCLLGTVVDSILKNLIDIGFTTEFEVYNVPFLSFIPFVESKMLLVVPSDSKYANQEIISFQELKQERFFFYKDYGKEVLVNWCRKKEMELSNIEIYDEPIALESLLIKVQMGAGITFIPEKLIPNSLSGVKLLSIAEDMPKVRLGFTWKRESENIAVQSFVNYIEKMHNKIQIEEDS